MVEYRWVKCASKSQWQKLHGFILMGYRFIIVVRQDGTADGVHGVQECPRARDVQDAALGRVQVINNNK